MFTIKLYKHDGAYKRLYEAESFTILGSDDGRRYKENDLPVREWKEITAHLKDGGLRFDIGDSPYTPDGGLWEKAIIENSGGRTTEIVTATSSK